MAKMMFVVLLPLRPSSIGSFCVAEAVTHVAAGHVADAHCECTGSYSRLQLRDLTSISPLFSVHPPPTPNNSSTLSPTPYYAHHNGAL